MTDLKNITAVAEAARAYVAKGWEPLPLKPKGKNPKGKWKDAVAWSDESIAGAFGGADNIGVALGSRSDDLVDLDFDWTEAARIADVLLHDAPSFGRSGSPRSHRVVVSNLTEGRVVHNLPPAAAKALSLDRATVLEIRGDGHQTMFPPSTHPSGEAVRWDGDPDVPPTVSQEDLERRCGLCATLAVVLKFYPRHSGDRDNICLALTGALVRAGLTDEEADHLVGHVAQLAGDEEARKRGTKGATTRKKIDADEPTWGLPELCARLGICDLEPTLRGWIGGSAEATAVKTSQEIRVLPGKLPEAVDQAEQALGAGEADFYQRGETLVRVVKLDANEAMSGVRRSVGTIILKPVSQAWLLEQMARAATWLKPAGKDEWKQVDPPTKVASTYLARVGEWKVPALVGVTQAPTLLADGTVLQEPGYDPASGLIFEPGGVEFPHVPERPSREEAEAALAVLEHPFRKFAFADEASRSVALAALLTALIRMGLRSAPMFALDAPTAGTGKSLLAETIGIIATGSTPPMMSQGTNNEENQKRLSSVVMAGDQLLVIDNCERTVSGDFLCSMLTQEIVQARVLGKSEIVKLPTRVTVIVTGNNLQLAGDVTRRALACRLDAAVERPDQLQFDFDPRDEARDQRPRLVAAGLTILRGYIAAGRPSPLPKIGSFEEWNLVREAIVWLRCADPKQTLDQLLASDPRKDELMEVLRLWVAAFGESELRVKDIPPPTRVGGTVPAEAEDDSRLALVEVLVGMTSFREFNPRSVGRSLSHHLDRIVGGMVLRARSDSSGTKLYRVQRVVEESSSSGPPAQDDIPF